MSKNILITGGAGFIGSNIAQELSKKTRVVICDTLNDPEKKKNIDEKNLKFCNYFRERT